MMPSTVLPFPAELPPPLLPPKVQTQVGLREPSVRPLSTVQVVLHDLGEFDIDAQQVRELVEQRVLIGFNIGVNGGGRLQLRVLTRSVEFFRATGGRKYHELEWNNIFRLLAPHERPVVTGVEIRRVLLCDRGHVENLILAGQLVAVKKSKWGPRGSWSVSRESYAGFLERRML
jgi:hypothetical protein